MTKLDIYRIVASVILGAVISIIIFFMLEVLLAQLLVDLILDQLGKNSYFNILLILLLGESIAVIINIVISILIIKQIKKSIVILSAGLALISNLFLLWFSISFIPLIIIYPEIFVNIEWYELPFTIPTLIMYFGIYIINDVTKIWLVTQITYFILFGFFIILFREKKKLRFGDGNNV